MHIFLQPTLLPPLQVHQQDKDLLFHAGTPYHLHCCALWRTVYWSLQLGVYPQDSGLYHWDLPYCLHCEMCQEEVPKR